MVPEHFFANVRQRIRREWVVCFFAALLIGLVAHFYKLVNWLPNWDALVFRYDAQDMTHFGRYFLSLVCGLSSYYELPWLNGLLCLLYLSLAAVCFLPNSTCHNLMTMGFYVFYLFFILFYERLNDGTSQKFIARKNWGILLLTAPSSAVLPALICPTAPISACSTGRRFLSC